MFSNYSDILDGIWRPLLIFVSSFIPSLSPSILLSSRKLRSMYNKASIVSAGLLLAILFVDFIPHLVEGGHSHSHGAGVAHSHGTEGHPHTHKVGGHIHVHKAADHSHTHGSKGHSHTHGPKGHTHSHDHSHTAVPHVHAWHDDLQVALIVGGLTLIVLIIVDQRVLKHSHCDKEKDVEIVAATSLEQPAHSHEGHAHSHTHDHSHAHSHESHTGHSHNHVMETVSKSEKSEAADKSLEIKGCCSEGLKYKTTVKQALIFIFIFSIHSIFEGFAFTPKQTNSLTMFLGLVVHKILESITVGIALFSSQFKKRISVGLLLFYSLLTPLGMILAYYISGVFDNKLLKDIFSGLSFGSLSFIVLVEMLPPIVHSLTNPIKIFYLFFGYAVGAVLISLVHCKGGCSL
ncbi:solute carrier family 39 (zinc transporter), member 1/2/3 [Nematocida minor]|uniref:solute carrier family 39 (zinc transporter), member 1/2/3 n=1 Tax=Nematocida minor TaxID=1912983 RepID=UPI0022203185|nr:solute carrier family 39 (zinc transporter), member 1/2/3 [Nematocida minor]KAI5190951.1 solute carrier family 39 (zinc transporter), member 1/2/3 [Nematocida minor]